MFKKRQRPDGEAPGHGSEEGSRKRPRTDRPHRPRPQAVDIDNIGAIKKRVRDIERQLARGNSKLPANKQRDFERELAAHKLRIEDARLKKDRSKMIQKYHMVRFFERKKAMRFAKQLEKRAAQATDPEEASQLTADLHVAQVDIDYAIYFPFMEPYISLYAAAASGEKSETNTAAHYLRTPRPPMWSVIEKTREEGPAALEKLQNRRPQTSSNSEAAQDPAEHDVPAKQSSKKARKRSPRNEAKTSKSKPSRVEEGTRRTNDDDDSDGGFFE
ncbi:hypothetical protein C8A00DRAFT_40323 [Chaetomidium leptoderma]|uniref:rRNA-processing protein EFG1 n=1 Tax=Chaetomidium leptoderma TaxID=669021 RepID=A0AAN6VT94_9PEZI|nr:hypothetical protein C8A00DRAFT_40323 [Chaetomidium leptoderma]